MCSERISRRRSWTPNTDSARNPTRSWRTSSTRTKSAENWFGGTRAGARPGFPRATRRALDNNRRGPFADSGPLWQPAANRLILLDSAGGCYNHRQTHSCTCAEIDRYPTGHQRMNAYRILGIRMLYTPANHPRGAVIGSKLVSSGMQNFQTQPTLGVWTTWSTYTV